MNKSCIIRHIITNMKSSTEMDGPIMDKNQMH